MCKRNIDQLYLVRDLTRDLAYSSGMCPGQELNQQPFALQDNAQPTELYQAGLIALFKCML